MEETIKYTEEFDEKSYEKILIDCRANNMLYLDVFNFANNLALLFILDGVLLIYPLVALLIILIGLKAGITGCDLGLSGKYTHSNRIFKIVDFANNFTFILTIMLLIKMIYIFAKEGSL